MNARLLPTMSLALAVALGIGPIAPAEAPSTRIAAAEVVEVAPTPTPEITPAEGTDDFAGSGTWNVVDGGNYYLGMTTAPGMLIVRNNGPGRVSVHIQWGWGFYSTIHLPPGATLRTNLPPGRHVEIWDGGRDGIGASGTYTIP